jgi:hypothetical protein
VVGSRPVIPVSPDATDFRSGHAIKGLEEHIDIRLLAPTTKTTTGRYAAKWLTDAIK